MHRPVACHGHVSWRERGVLIAMVVPIVWIGIYPDTFLRRIEPSVIELIEQVRPAVAEAPAPEDPPETAWLRTVGLERTQP